jgi:micrococcal nuclease
MMSPQPNSQHGPRPPWRPRYAERRWFVLLALAVLAVLQAWRSYSGDRPSTELPPEKAAVQRVVDGDTLLLPDRTRVRLIGVNAPESVKPDSPVEPFGPEASDFTKHFIAGGDVRLEFDKERLDQYGRTLAYVWVGDKLLNEELLRAGLARWERHYHYSDQKKSRFRRAEQEARDAKRGIWSIPAPRR